MEQTEALALRRGEWVVERETGWLWMVSGTPYRRDGEAVRVPVRDESGRECEFAPAQLA